MLQAKINNQTYEIETIEDSVILNQVQYKTDIVQINNSNFFHIIHRNCSYYLEVLSFNSETKTFKISHKGQSHDVEIKDRFDLLLKSMGLDSVSKPKVNDVKAPMPGLVLSIKVVENQEVKKGDAILILEAMKMENIIKSPVDGVVKNILVSEKQAIDKNQILINFI